VGFRLESVVLVCCVFYIVVWVFLCCVVLFCCGGGGGGGGGCLYVCIYEYDLIKIRPVCVARKRECVCVFVCVLVYYL